jgi:hypothetical protein
VNEKYGLDLSQELGDPQKINCRMGEFKSVFDLYFTKDGMNWLSWVKTEPPFQISKDKPYTQLIIPTVDSIRVSKLMT